MHILSVELTHLLIKQTIWQSLVSSEKSVITRLSMLSVISLSRFALNTSELTIYKTIAWSKEICEGREKNKETVRKVWDVETTENKANQSKHKTMFDQSNHINSWKSTIIKLTWRTVNLWEIFWKPERWKPCHQFDKQTSNYFLKSTYNNRSLKQRNNPRNVNEAFSTSKIELRSYWKLNFFNNPNWLFDIS